MSTALRRPPASACTVHVPIDQKKKKGQNHWHETQEAGTQGGIPGGFCLFIAFPCVRLSLALGPVASCKLTVLELQSARLFAQGSGLVQVATVWVQKLLRQTCVSHVMGLGAMVCRSRGMCRSTLPWSRRQERGGGGMAGKGRTHNRGGWGINHDGQGAETQVSSTRNSGLLCGIGATVESVNLPANTANCPPLRCVGLSHVVPSPSTGSTHGGGP